MEVDPAVEVGGLPCGLSAEAEVLAGRLLHPYEGADWFSLANLEECMARQRRWQAAQAQEKAALQAWAETFPTSVRAALAGFGSRVWQLARLARTDAGMQMITSNPGLAFCIANNWVFHPNTHPARTALRLMRIRRREAAGWLGFPPTEGSVNLLRKLDPVACYVPLLLNLRRMLADGSPPGFLASLRSFQRISLDALVALGNRALVERHLTPALLHDIHRAARPEGPVGDWQETFRDMLRMERIMDRPGNPSPLRSLKALTRLHQRIRRDLTAHIAANPAELSGFDLAGPLPPPPLPGARGIQPLVSAEEVVLEGQLMEHCVVSYLPEIHRVASAIYRVESAQGERCTLELRRSRSGWEIAQLRGRGNGHVSVGTRREVEQWFTAAGTASAAVSGDAKRTLEPCAENSSERTGLDPDTPF